MFVLETMPYGSFFDPTGKRTRGQENKNGRNNKLRTSSNNRMTPDNLDQPTGQLVGKQAQRQAADFSFEMRQPDGTTVTYDRDALTNRKNWNDHLQRQSQVLGLQLPQYQIAGTVEEAFAQKWKQEGTLGEMLDVPQTVLADKNGQAGRGLTTDRSVPGVQINVAKAVRDVHANQYAGGGNPSQQHVGQATQNVHTAVANLFIEGKYTQDELRNAFHEIHGGFYSEGDIDQAISELVQRRNPQQPATSQSQAPQGATPPAIPSTTPAPAPAPTTPTSATPSPPASSSSTFGQIVKGVLNFFGVGRQPSSSTQGKSGGTPPASSTTTPAPSTATPAPGTATPAPGTTTPAPAPTTPSSPLLKRFGVGGIGGGGTASGPGAFGPDSSGTPVVRTTTTPVPGTGGGGTGNGFIDSANILLQAALGMMNLGVGNNNPFFNMAKLLAAKSIVEVAKTLIEAGMTDEVVNESPMLKHKALLADAKASGLRGLFETWYQYWNQDAQANKQINKDNQGLAPRA